MKSDAAVAEMIDALEAAGVPWMLVGSFSSNYYGVPRSTKDADFVVQLEGGALTSVTARLGEPFQLDPQTRFETVTGTTRHLFRLGGSAFQVELFRLSDDAHDRQRFDRRVQRPLLERNVWLPTAEDVVITKLRWLASGSRGRDREDIAGVIGVQGDGLDWDYIYGWCDVHATRTLVEEIRRTVSGT